jgi:sigma-E factor negative regulatory protein RseB
MDVLDASRRVTVKRWMRGSNRAATVVRVARSTIFGVAVLAAAPAAFADDAIAWLEYAATAAKQLNYLGTIVYQQGGNVESSKLVHLNDRGEEYEKLVSLEGPAREVIRSRSEVRCYYPDYKVVRIEARTLRHAFPSISPEQQRSLAEYYEFRKAETGRVAGIPTQAWVFEPKDGMRYGHKFWADANTGLLVKARMIDDRNNVIQQYAFTEIRIGADIDRDMVKPTWPGAPADWQVRQSGPGEAEMKETGWVVNRVPPGFMKIAEAYRSLKGKGNRRVVHLVFSDGLVAVSVFVESTGGERRPTGLSSHGGIHVYTRQVDDNLVTVLGETPAITVKQIGNSVAQVSNPVSKR